MNRLFLILAGITAMGVYFVAGPVLVNSYRAYRTRRTVICPETDQIAEVELKALRAGLMSILGKHSVRVKWCSLWPRKKGCSEECMKENWP
jgi:hypothetical protein